MSNKASEMVRFQVRNSPTVLQRSGIHSYTFYNIDDWKTSESYHLPKKSLQSGLSEINAQWVSESRGKMH